MDEARSFKFTVPGEPRGKGRPRATTRGKFVKLYTDAQTASYENLIKLAWVAAVGDMPPLSGPLCVTVRVYFGIPKSTPKNRLPGMLDGSTRPIKRPDLDNVMKAVLDGLNGVAFVDDAQVVNLRGFKFYRDQPGLWVDVRQLEA